MINRRTDRIGKVYQRHLGSDNPIYVTGSVALYRAIAIDGKEQWQLKDMDTFVPNTTNDNLKQRGQSIRAACKELGGRWQMIHYALTHQNSAGMLDVIAKSKCSLSSFTVSTIFSNSPISKHLENAKPPAVVAYEANDPSTLIVADNHRLKHLSKRQIVSAQPLDLQTLSKYSPRGFYAIDEKYVGAMRDLNTVETDGKTVEIDRKTIEINKKIVQREDLKGSMDRIMKEERGSFITAKIHFRTSSAWKNLHLAQGIFTSSVGLITGAILAIRRRPICAAFTSSASILVGGFS